MTDEPVYISEESVYEAMNNLISEFVSNPEVEEVKVAGRQSRELRNVLLTIRNPRKRWGHSGLLQYPNVFRSVGRVIWELCGRTRAEEIKPYDKVADRYAVSGLIQAPYGERIMAQMPRLISHLQLKPTSRRGVIRILLPDDEYDTKTEFPCVVGLHFYIRNGALSCTCYMRSQSVVKLIAQDCFIFTILQEYVASALSVPLGQYHHFIMSAHVFDSDRYTDDYIESEWSDVEEAVFPSEGDPDDLDQMVSRIGEAEQAIRQGPPEIATRLIDDLELAAGYETWAVWLRVVHKIFVPHLPVSLPVIYTNYLDKLGKEPKLV